MTGSAKAFPGETSAPVHGDEEEDAQGGQGGVSHPAVSSQAAGEEQETAIPQSLSALPGRTKAPARGWCFQLYWKSWEPRRCRSLLGWFSILLSSLPIIRPSSQPKVQ